MISRQLYVLLYCPLAFAECAAKVRPVFFPGVDAVGPTGLGLELPWLAAALRARKLRVEK